uniref:Ig-like domain-containing protein n=1 Tax=Astyanax mexicanus TaxID=7994 RepID=A0A3B1IVT3_ASTMX
QTLSSSSGSTVVAPGQSTTLTCRVSGYSLTDSSYCTHWIRQPGGKALEWVARMCGSGNAYYSDKLKSRFVVSRDTSSSTVSLRGQNLQTEDTAVYYCARYPL